MLRARAGESGGAVVVKVGGGGLACAAGMAEKWRPSSLATMSRARCRSSASAAAAARAGWGGRVSVGRGWGIGGGLLRCSAA